jgi:poly [ADP-ribose] polymerase 2/3/4
VKLLENGREYRTWTRWGRVGERGQSATLGSGSLDDALKHFDKKFKDKSGLKWQDRGENPKSGKYVFVERSYEPDSEEDEDAPAKAGASRARSTSPPKCTLAAPVKSLMELIFNQQYIEQAMASLNYDSKKMPLGKLSKATISRGYLPYLLDSSAVPADMH